MDDFRSEAREHFSWTPPYGMKFKKVQRRLARARLKRALRRIINRIAPRSWAERIKEEDYE